MIFSKRISSALFCSPISHYCYQYHLRPTPPVTAKGLPITYSWHDDHVYAYGELSVAVWNFIHAGGNIEILLPPRKPEEWIAKHEANIEAARGDNLGVMDLGLSDDVELEEFNESVVHDDDEYEDHELDNSEKEDDGIVLDSMG